MKIKGRDKVIWIVYAKNGRSKDIKDDEKLDLSSKENKF